MEPDADAGLDLFVEPPDFRPPSPKPTRHVVARKPENVQQGPASFHINLIGNHSLWAHVLWNSGICLGNYLDANKELVAGKCVLELGAGAAFPSYVAAVNGATRVVITEYPEPRLMENLRQNTQHNLPAELASGVIDLQGYVWGQYPSSLIANLPSQNEGKFDVILMADLIFNHSAHKDLLQTCKQLLRPKGIGKAYFIYSHHRTHLIEKDMEFFTVAQAPPFEFAVEKFYSEVVGVMFANDPGDEKVRATVDGFILTLP